jgi:hypothetical protein
MSGLSLRGARSAMMALLSVRRALVPRAHTRLLSKRTGSLTRAERSDEPQNGHDAQGEHRPATSSPHVTTTDSCRMRHVPPKPGRPAL